MKKLASIAAGMMMIGTMFLASCAKDEPEPTDPGTGDPRDKFTFTWFNTENSQDFGSSTYNVTISDSSNASYILFGYLYGFNTKIYATVSGNNFTIPTQLVSGNNVSGSGMLVSNNQINMTYLVQSTTTHYDTVSCVLTK